MATFSSLVFRRLIRTASLDKSSLQLQSKRITDNLSDVVRIEQNGSKQLQVCRLMPCPSTSPKMFCDGQFFEPAQKFDCF